MTGIGTGGSAGGGRADVALWLTSGEGGHTLHTALGSVAAQTVLPAEILVVDDGSRGEAVSVAERWAGRFEIRVVRCRPDEEPGQACARNSASPWIAQLDPRDFLLPDHLATLLGARDAARTRDETIVTPREVEWDPTCGLWPARGLRELPRADQQFAAMLEHNFVSPHALFPRSVYDRVGGLRPELGASSAWDLWIRMLRAGARIVRTDHATVLRRVDHADAGPLPSETDLEVLRLACAEAIDGTERALAETARRRHLARTELLRAYEHARHDRTWEARRRAFAALREHGRVVPMAWFMLFAPKSGLALRDCAARRHEAAHSAAVLRSRETEALR